MAKSASYLALGAAGLAVERKLRTMLSKYAVGGRCFRPQRLGEIV